MADLVKFFVGNQENLDNLQKIKGQLVIALDTSNSTSPKGTLYYDYNSAQRVKLSSETAEKAIGDETGLNIRSNYLTSVEGSRNNTLYTITAKTGSGVTKNTFNIPINLVSSSATSSKIFLLGAITQSNDANNSYTNNNFYIENNILNGTFKGNITGKATTAGTADVALSVGWNNISDKPTNSIVSQIYKDTNGLNYKTLNGNVTNLGLFAPLDSNSKTIPIEYIPKSAIERLFKVTSLEYLMANVDEFPDLNLGDTILDLSDNIMYYIIGSDLTSADSYQEYSAGIASAVEWSNILNKPTTLVSSFLTSESTTAFTITPRAYTGSNLTAITIPFANTSRAGLITTLAQSFAGNKTFMGDITIGNNTDATARTLYIRRKNSSSSNYGTFSITLPTTANYADIGFQYNKSGTNSGYNLYMNSSALYPKSNNAYDLGTSSNKFKTVYATTFNGNATTATRATSDSSGNNINTTYIKSVTGASGTGYTITVTKGSGSTSSFTIPLATTGGLGLVSTGTQSFAGAKTFASTITVNGDVYIGNNGKGYYLKDKKSRNYAGINDNGSNFWIGSSGSSGGSHYGGTYLSTGFDDNNEGNDTFIVSIPHVSGTSTYSHTSYYGLHSGNWKSYISDWRSLSWTNGTTAGPVPVFTDRVGGGKTNGAAIPVATSAVSGVVSTGSQTFAGDKNFTGTVAFVKTADASGVSGNYPAVIIGGAATSAHLELDANEIMAKGSINSVAPLYLNNEGGVVDIGSGGMNVRGHITSGATSNTLDIGTSSNKFRNIYGTNFYGNASSATLLKPHNSNITYQSSNWNSTGSFVWGMGFKDSSLGGDSGNITLSLVKYSDSQNTLNLCIDGQINAGSVRTDRVGFIGNLQGNASTATKLQTARTINGTSFNGTANITTANWGTTRTLTIGKKANSVNGSSNVTWSLWDMGALSVQGDTWLISLTGGDGNNRGYKLIATATLRTWDNYRTLLCVTSRHSGNGFYSIAYGNNSSTLDKAHAYCSIEYFGNSNGGDIISSNSIRCYVSNDGKTLYFFYYYYDYDAPNISCLAKIAGGFIPVNDGAWMTSIDEDTYGTLLASTNINVATRLQTARTIRTNLGSTSTASFDGTANITPGITGTLPIANGGTGATSASGARTALGITPANIGAAATSHNHSASGITSGTLPIARGGTGLASNPSLLVNLGATSAASVFAASPRPGITGILAVSHGGTGASSASTARTNLGAAAAEHTHAFTEDITGTVPINRGGTGAWDAGAACTNLGAVTISTSQSITGAKTFKGSVYIQNSTTGPTISFQSSNTSNVTSRTATIYNSLVSTTATQNFLYFRLYRRETGGAVTSYYEEYRLPTATSNRTSNRSYEILTSKVPVTVRQGGTGTSTKGAQSGGALANIGCIYSSSEPSSPYTGMVWLKPVT